MTKLMLFPLLIVSSSIILNGCSSIDDSPKTGICQTAHKEYLGKRKDSKNVYTLFSKDEDGCYNYYTNEPNSDTKRQSLLDLCNEKNGGCSIAAHNGQNLVFLESDSNSSSGVLSSVLAVAAGVALAKKADDEGKLKEYGEVLGSLAGKTSNNSLSNSSSSSYKNSSLSVYSNSSGNKRELFQKFPRMQAAHCVKLKTTGKVITTGYWSNICSYPIHVKYIEEDCKYKTRKNYPFKGVDSSSCSGIFSLKAREKNRSEYGSNPSKKRYIACKKVSVNDFSPHYTSIRKRKYNCFKAVYN